MKSNLFPIAKEGFIYIFYSVLAYFIFSFLDCDLFAFLSLLISVGLIFVYRNPERELSLFGENSVVSPVDGVVLSIEESDDEYAYKVEIESDYKDVSILRVPMTSTLKKIDLKRGARLSKNNSLAPKINEKVDLIYEDKNSNRLKISHMLKQSFSSIKLSVKESQHLPQGMRYGVMVSGVTTIYIPQNFRLSVSVGNEVKASESLIGYLS